MGDCRKSVNNFHFYFILFYSISPIFLGRFLLRIIFILFYFILLVLYFWEESNWDCTSGVSFLLQVESPSILSHVLITSRVPLGLCQWPIKAGHPSLSIYEYQFFREYFHISIWRNFFKTRVVHISLTECTQGKIWLLNPGGRPLVPQCIEFVFEEGGSISRTVFVMPQSISFSSY